MQNFENFNIFKSDREMTNDDDISKNKENLEDRPFTFKITKRRSPWTSEVRI
jgi:hypothetical protein